MRVSSESMCEQLCDSRNVAKSVYVRMYVCMICVLHTFMM